MAAAAISCLLMKYQAVIWLIYVDLRKVGYETGEKGREARAGGARPLMRLEASVLGNTA